jgi:hypothetical protein
VDPFGARSQRHAWSIAAEASEKTMSYREREPNLQLRRRLTAEYIGGDSFRSFDFTYLSRRLSCLYFISGDNR